MNAQRAGVFVTINATDGKGRETENIVRVRALFNDLDGAPLGPVTQSKPTPHIVVESSPGRFHPYWLVDNVELKEFTVLQKGLIEHFDGDKAVHDLPRVMRLPGFVHRKSKPFLSRIISTHDAPAYKAADFGRIIKTTNTKNYFEEVGERERQQSNGPTQKLNDAALANLAAWVPQVFPTARPYHGDGFRVSSVDLGRELEEDISFTREGIKDFGVHDLDDPLEGKRTPVNLVMEHLFEVPVEDIARKNNKAEFRKACEWLRERVEPEQDEPELKKTLMQSSAEFVVGFVPPDYLIDGLLQRRYVYSLTGPTGSGKTAIALRIAIHVALGLALAEREVVKGRVLIFAGENPDDVRTRWIKLCEYMDVEAEEVDVVFMPFTPDLSEKKIRKQIDAEAEERGPFSLLIVDTSAAYYSGDDENDNVALGNHARLLRSFVDLPGGPTILVTCHPTKNPNMDNLLPRGGGAFLAEVDGNLAAIKERSAMVVEVTTHGKFRGPEFAPFCFELKAATSDKLKDSKGRSIWTVIATPISNEEQEALEEQGHRHQDDLLRAMLDKPGLSLAEMAEYLLWKMIDGRPHKMRVQRMMSDLVKNKLVEKRRDGHYALTRKGKEEAEKLPEAAVKEVKPQRRNEQGLVY